VEGAAAKVVRHRWVAIVALHPGLVRCIDGYRGDEEVRGRMWGSRKRSVSDERAARWKGREHVRNLDGNSWEGAGLGNCAATCNRMDALLVRVPTPENLSCAINSAGDGA
jgi:hypothetical protein